MALYSTLKLMEHVPVPAATCLDGGEDGGMVSCCPYVLNYRDEREAFSLFVAGYDEHGAALGYTMLYYSNTASGWYRWLFERNDLPKEKRWVSCNNPLSGIDAAVAYERRVEALVCRLTPDDVDCLREASPLNGNLRFVFGRYRGRTARDVLFTDFDYFQWAFQNNADFARDVLRDDA